MIAKCKWCERTFDTHDGGSRCPKCENVACPSCEQQHFQAVAVWRTLKSPDGRADFSKHMAKVEDGGTRCRGCGTVMLI